MAKKLSRPQGGPSPMQAAIMERLAEAAQRQPESSALAVVVAPDKSILVGENFIIHENRLEIVGQVDQDAWLEFARWMRSLDDTLQWALGDLVVYADEQRAAWIEETGLTETELESKYKDLIETTGYAYGTLRKFASFARRFPPFRRRNTLSYSHHVEVAALTDEQQEYLLDQAEVEKWSRNQLRLAAQGIDLSGNGTVAENAQVETEADSPAGDKEEFIPITTEEETATLTDPGIPKDTVKIQKLVRENRYHEIDTTILDRIETWLTNLRKKVARAKVEAFKPARKTKGQG